MNNPVTSVARTASPTRLFGISIVSLVSIVGTFSARASAQCDGAWSIAATSGPSPRGEGRIAFDRVRGVAVLFGGYIGGNNQPPIFNDTWEWNGTAWSQSTPTNVPKARSEHGLVVDQARGQTVLFGGYCLAQPNCDSFIINPGDTWTWNGVDWTGVAAVGPSARRAFGMAYDSVRQVTVLYGGATINFPVGAAETWEWNGTAWAQRLVSGPPGLYYTRMCFDRRRNKVVLYGGSVQSDGMNPPYNYQTWEYDGTAWTHAASDGPVETNGGIYALDYSEARGRTIMIGKHTGGGAHLVTFEWTGLAWKQLQALPPNWPNDQWGGRGMVVYDPVRRDLITHALTNGETWRFSIGCVADFDCSATTSVGDIFVYLTAWFANTATADFDGANGVSVADIFAFLAAWFAGCP